MTGMDRYSKGISKLRRRAAAKIAHMSKADAQSLADEVCALPQMGGHRSERKQQITREITGYWSQGLDSMVWKMIGEKMRGVRK